MAVLVHKPQYTVRPLTGKALTQRLETARAEKLLRELPLLNTASAQKRREREATAADISRHPNPNRSQNCHYAKS